MVVEREVNELEDGDSDTDQEWKDLLMLFFAGTSSDHKIVFIEVGEAQRGFQDSLSKPGERSSTE
jgi:hypothetical protein